MQNSISGNCIIEMTFQQIPEGYGDILTAELLEAGFTGFSGGESALLGYIGETAFNENMIRRIIIKYPQLRNIRWSITRLPDKNWNEEWERNYDPVLIAGTCYIRAPFHAPYPASRIPDPESHIEIIIEPKMSFGTAHHETTALMIEWLLDENVSGKKILDMGCGTGVLAILTQKLNAQSVVAIDNDKPAYENACENIRKNNTSPNHVIHVIHGDEYDIPDQIFELILANINRNILMEQIPAYARHLTPGGILFVSGFYAEDFPAIRKKATETGFKLTGTRMKNEWMAVKFAR